MRCLIDLQVLFACSYILHPFFSSAFIVLLWQGRITVKKKSKKKKKKKLVHQKQ